MRDSFSKNENIISGVISIFGLIISSLITLLMFEVAETYGDLKCKIITFVFSLTVILYYMISCIYHFSKKEKYKKFFRKINISSFFLLVASMVLPLSLITIGEVKGAVVFSLSAVSAVICSVVNFINFHKNKTLTAVFLVISTFSVYLFSNLIIVNTTKINFLIFILSSVLIIIAGIFYRSKNPFSHIVFHGFLLISTTLNGIMTLLEVIPCEYMKIL